MFFILFGFVFWKYSTKIVKAACVICSSETLTLILENGSVLANI